MRTEYELDAVDGELRIFVEPESSTWCCVGTRAQIEAGGVLPHGVEWSSLVGAEWVSGQLRYTLSGGLRKKGLSPEHSVWRLRCECECQGFNGNAIKHAKRELDRLMFEDSSAGLVQFWERCRRAEAAAADCAFQKFLGNVMPRRARRASAPECLVARRQEIQQ